MHKLKLKNERVEGRSRCNLCKMEAEAKGLYEILTKQAEGYKRSHAGGDP
jgi:flotillin